MTQTQNARPEAGGFGTGAKTAGEDVTASVTDQADKPQHAVPVWIHRRGGDPVVARRRISARLDDLLGISRARTPEPYAAGGMTLDVAARERAA